MANSECFCCICGCLLGRAQFKRRRHRRRSRSSQQQHKVLEHKGSENEASKGTDSEEDSPKQEEVDSEVSEQEDPEDLISPNYERDDDDDEPGGMGYDQQVLSIEEARWTDEFRALGWNKETEATFLTGTAKLDFNSCVKVRQGGDPNFPEDALDSDGWAWFAGQRDDDGVMEWPGVAPFHDICFEMLSQYIQGLTGTNEEVQGQPLYDSLIDEFIPNRFIDYGEGYPNPQQFWDEVTGEEVFVANPFWSKSIERFSENLPIYEAPQPLAFDVKNKVQRDLFSSLPVEIIYNLFELLPMADILAFRQASWFVLRAELSNSFWKRRIKLEMPWYWELKHTGDAVDFKSLFGLLETRTRYREYPETKTKTNPGLANRRRIWHICEQLGDDYFASVDPSRIQFPANGNSGYIEAYSKAAQQVSTALPVTENMESVKTFWVRSWGDVDSLKADFKFYWGLEGSLVGIGVDFGNFGQRNFGFTDFYEEVETVTIENDDWINVVVLIIDGKLDPLEEKNSAAIKGIELETTAGLSIRCGSTETGHKRYLPITPGHVLVGAVDHPGVDRLVNPEADKRLWKDGLLPTPLIRVLPFKLGSLPLKPGLDFAPHEQLIFGMSEEELSKVTRISACVRPGGIRKGVFVPGGSRVEYSITGFRVDYSDGVSSKEIGECVDEFMKGFEIDGAAGERVSIIQIEMNEWAKNVKFFTNTGRVSDIFGDYEPPNWNYKNDQKAAKDETLIGMCATFGLPRGYRLDEDGKPDLTPTHRTATTVSGLAMPNVHMCAKSD